MPRPVSLRDDKTMDPWPGQSDTISPSDIHTSDIKYHSVRSAYLRDPGTPHPPVLAASPFIPRALIDHLMRNKKDSALGVKYVPGDAITDMEGAAHTFLTPLVRAWMHGDYAYKGAHTMLPFPPYSDPSNMDWKGPSEQARELIVSAAIQPDFEDTRVMLALARVGNVPFAGADWPEWSASVPSAEEKKKPGVRAKYDERVRAHLVHHLVGSLPALSQIQPMSTQQAIAYIEAGNHPRGAYATLPRGAVVSLDLLWRVYVEMLSNELGGLEALAPQGYVYTSDPPAIFAREADATLLNRLQAAALAHLVQANPGRLKHMRIFAFNDYADPHALPVFARALNGTGVRVMRKADLFPASKGGHYAPPKEGRGAYLVIHNNSDAFGQNIETEGPSSSMDGAIGCASSAAWSLQRHRKDLTSQILSRAARLRVRIP